MNGYQLRKIRLVNFHNFVDETVEIREGGHLFLLGDNGSGKTTVLDAVHLVLSGDQLELNAAARVGGRREDGRTLQGVVLRYDFEHGVRNAGGAIAYAAIELVDPVSGRCITVGIGAEATTMEARVTRWGFVVSRALDEVRLLDEEERPLDRDGLRRVLGAASVHASLGGYRKELARRLFGSETQYEEAVRFWGMAKAYREIVAGARDFGALFERLLPTPDGTVFEEILRTLRAIDDLEVAVRELDVQRTYAQGLTERRHDVAVAREAAARYVWLAHVREREETDVAVEREAEALDRWTREAERERLDAEAARLRSEGANEVLRRAESDDSADVLRAIRELEGRRRPLAIDVARSTGDAEEGRREHVRRSQEAVAARARFAGLARVAGDELRAAVAGASELPGELGAIARLADRLDAIAMCASKPDGVLDGLPDTQDASTTARAVAEARARAAIAADLAAQQAATRRDHRGAEVNQLEAQDPALALDSAQVAARRALAAAGIEARAVYELLEPKDGADPRVVAAIESLAGDAVLGALVVDRARRAEARTIVTACAPEVRVLIETTEVALPGWCSAVLADESGDGVGNAVLATVLSQPQEMGEVAAPDGADVSLRGLAHRVAHEEPRWIGIAARRRAHDARLRAARDELAAAETALREMTRLAEAGRAALERSRRLSDAVADAHGGTLVGAWHDVSTQVHRERLAKDAWRGADERRHGLAERLDGLEREISTLRARSEGVDLDALEQRLARLRDDVQRSRDAWHERVGKQAEAMAEARQADARMATARARSAELASLLDDATVAVRRAMAAAGLPSFDGDDVALAHHVRVTLRGDSFRSLETLQQRIADEERAAAVAADELGRDGSRGVRHLVHASRFGFAYDRITNGIEDRRGQPLAGVLAELDRTIAEQRSVVNERTRALMDTLVMGELARHLQGQVHRLGETIKGINRVLRGLRFGPTEYQFQVTPRPDRADVIELVRRVSVLDEESRLAFRTWIDARLDELRAAEDHVPALLDYRQWFEFKLRMSTTDAEGVELTHKLKQVGSGGEQGVPNYLLVLSLAKLMFDSAGATIRPLLFDEAFYGIDAGRRDQLLHLATDLGLQLLVASPDQDGATEAVRAATTLFVIKDANHDVHLAPYHWWNRARAGQVELFEAELPDPGSAECVT